MDGKNGPKNPDHIGAAAYPYMNLMALTTLVKNGAGGNVIDAQQPRIFTDQAENSALFHAAGVATVGALMTTVMAGADLMDFAEEEL